MGDPKPLCQMNFSIVQEPLTGLLRNIDMDLQRQIQETRVTGDQIHVRQLLLLLIMLRAVSNDYQAACFLVSDLDEHHKRLPRFVLAVPAINRQMMDLWFSLVYIMDDFDSRSLAYELYAYRQLREHIEETRKRYGAIDEWKDWFEDSEQVVKMMEAELPLTAENKADPVITLTSWPHPHALTERVSKSQDFLKLLHDLIYADTSITAHFKPAGLMEAAGILLLDVAPDDIKKNIENRVIHQYKFRHLCRTVLTVLAIASEIEVHCGLGNREQALRIWNRLAEYNADTADIFKARYKSLLGDI